MLIMVMIGMIMMIKKKNVQNNNKKNNNVLKERCAKNIFGCKLDDVA
jgi:hypothetical protein